jgi:hypothetical protein
MKHFVFVFLFVFNFSYSENIEGYYITTNNKKFTKVFDIPVEGISDEVNFQAIQFVLKYYDENNKKHKLDLEFIYEVGFEYNGEKIILRKLRNELDLAPNLISDKRYILLKLIKEDIISEYLFSRTGYMLNANGFGGSAMGSFYKYGSGILVKKDGTMVDPSIGSFRKKMREFFSDCPVLVEKINNKVYKRTQIDEVIEYYKVNCYKE